MYILGRIVVVSSLYSYHIISLPFLPLLISQSKHVILLKIKEQYLSFLTYLLLSFYMSKCKPQNKTS